MSLVKRFGSLTFALVLIASLAATLVFSTVSESLYGTPFARKAFYDTRWFDVFLSLFAVNIFCSTLTRFPFKKHHIGFVVTHIGILLVLAGSLATRVWGVEGQMTLFEGETDSRLMKENYIVTVSGPGHTERHFPLEKLPSPLARAGGFEVSVDEVLKNAEEKKVLAEGPAGGERNYAVEAALGSESAGFAQDFFLIEHDDDDPDSRSASVGPAMVSLGGDIAPETSPSPVLHLMETTSGSAFSVPLDEATLKNGAEVPDLGLRISNIRYYPHAKVKDNVIIDAPDEVKYNPAVEFQVSDAKGRKEQHTKFSLFPEFQTLRGGAANNFFDLAVELDVPMPRKTPAAAAGPSLTFYPSPSGVWKYRITSSKSVPKEGEVKEGGKIETGWMDIRLEVKKLYDRARFLPEVVTTPGSGTFAVKLKEKNGAGGDTVHWLWPGRPHAFETTAGPVTLVLAPETSPLPFSLKLKDFRKVDYPGTENPMSYESDVVLSDAAEGFSIQKTIKMNKPLDYKGYRVFQSSYIQDETMGEASVFSIAKNPGIALIYPGAVVILVGVILLFYFHPFFNRGLR